jgi:hypothetical protein
MTLEGMASPARIWADVLHCAKIGHFYFAATDGVRYSTGVRIEPSS